MVCGGFRPICENSGSFNAKFRHFGTGPFFDSSTHPESTN
jgi:hypothetical protein